MEKRWWGSSEESADRFGDSEGKSKTKQRQQETSGYNQAASLGRLLWFQNLRQFGPDRTTAPGWLNRVMSRSGPVHIAVKPRRPNNKTAKCCGADTKSRHLNERHMIQFEPVLPEWAELAETSPAHPTEPWVGGVTFAGKSAHR